MSHEVSTHGALVAEVSWFGQVPPTIVVSLSASPGTVGMTVHNAGYAALGLNFVYLALSTDNLATAIAAVRVFNFRGCSVSMPFKEPAMDLVDEVSNSALEVGAINTIVNENGVLHGHNTDVTGLRYALSLVDVDPTDSVLILGGGGLARAALAAARAYGLEDITIAVRNPRRVKGTRLASQARIVPWDERWSAPVRILVNATPIGMTGASAPVHWVPSELEGLSAVIDGVVTSRPTSLIETARALGIANVPGSVIALAQAEEQFHLYTGLPAPQEVMRAALHAKIERDLS